MRSRISFRPRSVAAAGLQVLKWASYSRSHKLGTWVKNDSILMRKMMFQLSDPSFQPIRDLRGSAAENAWPGQGFYTGQEDLATSCATNRISVLRVTRH